MVTYPYHWRSRDYDNMKNKLIDVTKEYTIIQNVYMFK